MPGITSVVNLGILGALDDQKPGKSPFHASQRVIHDRVIARHVKLELGDHSATGRNRDGLAFCGGLMRPPRL